MGPRLPADTVQWDWCCPSWRQLHMAGSKPLTRRGALGVGLLFIACGAIPILMGLGVIEPSRSDAPPWIAVAAGLVFVCGGLAVILDYAIVGGVDVSGDLPVGTPLALRIANFLLGLSIVGLMLAMSGWIAFGPGERRFSSTISLPFVWGRRGSGEVSGRIAFGVGTVMIAVMFVAFGISGVRRLIRASREGRRLQEASASSADGP
jgi:hypothetical protein